MANENVTRDNSLDVESLLAEVTSETVKEENGIPVVPESERIKTPLQMMQERANKGMVIQNNQDDGPLRASGALNEDRLADVNQTLDDLDMLIDKAKQVQITKKPTSDIEMAELVDSLDQLDIDELKAASAGADKNAKTVDHSNVMGEEMSASTIVASEEDPGTIAGGKFRIRTDEAPIVTAGTSKEENEVTPAGDVKVIVKDVKEDVTGNKIVNFTDEEREKLVQAKQIELVTVKSLQVPVGEVVRPSEQFLEHYKETLVEKISSYSVPMTFVGSRFRATMRALTFGEYTDLALAREITELDQFKKKLSVIYNSMLSCSIGLFATFDEFLQNFAFVDLPLATYALYRSTNPDTLEMSIRCGKEDCMPSFEVSFNTANLLALNRTSERFLKTMEQVGNAEGEEAQRLHEESSLITRKVIELPVSKIGCEMGLRSCYEMVYDVLPYQASLEKMAEADKDNASRIREIISYVTRYVTAIYLPDENGKLTNRVDSVTDMVELILDLPMRDYGIITSIISVTEEDYHLEFGIPHVVCPKCGTVTELVPLDIDAEVFQRFQEQGAIELAKETLPRL